MYPGALQHIRNVESCIIAGPGSNDRCSPESIGCTPEWTTEFGDISAEPNRITDPIPFDAFPGHMERNQSRFLLPTIVMSNLPEKGDSVPVMILLSFCVSRWTTFQCGNIIGHGRRPEDK